MGIPALSIFSPLFSFQGTRILISCLLWETSQNTWRQMAQVACVLETTCRPLEKTLCNYNIRAQVQHKQDQIVWNTTAASLETLTMKWYKFNMNSPFTQSKSIYVFLKHLGRHFEIIPKLNAKYAIIMCHCAKTGSWGSKQHKVIQLMCEERLVLCITSWSQ